MKAHIERWDDTLVVRIPADLADASGLEENSSVELTLVNGKLVIAPAAPMASLEEVLQRVSPKLQSTWETVPSVGAEVWFG
jgi:antitoxin component of MazEF toxin-antitoxin module